jgi:hypothetical protein
VLAVALVAMLLPGRRLLAEELAPKKQALLLLRVLAYDRNLRKRGGEQSASVVILYREGNENSESLSADMTSALDEVASTATVSGLAVRSVAIAYNSPAELDSKLVAQRAAAVYLCPGLGDAVPLIVGVARKRTALTLTSTASYSRAGVSIGLFREEDKPLIVVNLPAARAEGADLEAGLLDVVRVIR